MAGRLSADGVPVVGVPKTIDNDLAGTDYTFGFDTAVQIATDAIDRLHTTAESHNRVIVVEVMGRHAGWIAAHAGLAGGARRHPRPRAPVRHRRRVRAHPRRHASGRTFSIVVVSEGAVPRDGCGITTASAETDAFGHARLGGIGVELEREIEERTGYETRMTILGHVQRGGTPTAYDRVLASRFGVEAVARWWTRAASGRWSRCAARRSWPSRWPRRSASPSCWTRGCSRRAEVFFG